MHGISRFPGFDATTLQPACIARLEGGSETLHLITRSELELSFKLKWSPTIQLGSKKSVREADQR